MNRRIKLWLMATAVVILVIDGLLLYLWIAYDLRVYVVMLAATMVGAVVYAMRLRCVLVAVPKSVQSAALLLLAPLLPCNEALTWLPELDGQLQEVAAEPARWRAVRSDAVRNTPRLVMAAWAGWVRAGLVAAAVRYAAPRLTAIDRLQRSSQPQWPTSRHDLHVRRKWLRTSRRCANLLLWCVGRRHESNIAQQARRLVGLCALARRHLDTPAQLPSTPARSLIIEINRTTMALAEATAAYRPRSRRQGKDPGRDPGSAQSEP